MNKAKPPKIIVISDLQCRRVWHKSCLLKASEDWDMSEVRERLSIKHILVVESSMIKCQIIMRWFGYFGLAPLTRIIECNESKLSFTFLTFTEEKNRFLMIFKLFDHLYFIRPISALATFFRQSCNYPVVCFIE